MSLNPEKKNTAQEIVSLRDTFAARARQAQKMSRDLEEQARQKRDEAENLTRQAIVMHQAYELLQLETNGNAVSASFDSLSQKDIEKLGKRQFIFLIDGSGSMHGAPLNGTLKAAQAFAEKITAAGGQVDSMMFGNQDPIRFDILDAATREKVSKGPTSGTDLAPSLQSLTLAAVIDKRKSTHMVIFSDGDMFDADASAAAVKTLAAEYPKITFDVMQISGRSGGYASLPPQSYALRGGLPYFFDKPKIGSYTAMAKLFGQLSQVDMGGRKVGFVDVQENDAVEALGNIIAKRLEETAPKPAAKPKASKKTPGV